MGVAATFVGVLSTVGSGYGSSAVGISRGQRDREREAGLGTAERVVGVQGAHLLLQSAYDGLGKESLELGSHGRRGT